MLLPFIHLLNNINKFNDNISDFVHLANLLNPVAKMFIANDMSRKNNGCLQKKFC